MRPDPLRGVRLPADPRLLDGAARAARPLHRHPARAPLAAALRGLVQPPLSRSRREAAHAAATGMATATAEQPANARSKPLARRCAFPHNGIALVPRRRETRLGMKWECGEEGPNPGFQFRSCPRNCKRRAHPHRSHRKREGAGSRHRPASQETSPSVRSVEPAVGGTARRSHERSVDLGRRRPPALPSGRPLLALAFGLLIVYGAGFAYPTALHNATHDTRHAFGLPCH